MVPGVVAMSFDLSDYNDVPSRIAEFREKHPEGSLASEVVETGFAGFVAVKGYAYRTPDDPRPGIGMAWEPVPGKTPYTKDSELQNAETSAWGRAIIAVGAADAKKGIASAEEIRNRQESSQAPEPPPRTPKQWVWDESAVFKGWTQAQRKAAAKAAMEAYAFDELEDMEQAQTVLEHMRTAYEAQPTEQETLEV